MLECAGERAGGRDGRVAADVSRSIRAALPLYASEQPEHDYQVNRNQIQTKSVEGDLWDQTEVSARFKVLGIRHASGGGS